MRIRHEIAMILKRYVILTHVSFEDKVKQLHYALKYVADLKN